MSAYGSLAKWRGGAYAGYLNDPSSAAVIPFAEGPSPASSVTGDGFIGPATNLAGFGVVLGSTLILTFTGEINVSGTAPSTAVFNGFVPPLSGAVPPIGFVNSTDFFGNVNKGDVELSIDALGNVTISCTANASGGYGIVVTVAVQLL